MGGQALEVAPPAAVADHSDDPLSERGGDSWPRCPDADHLHVPIDF
jgi:hypothetical protein